MRYASVQVVFQEVPDEISLAFSITGCDLQCRGGHSAQTWDASSGTLLDEAAFLQLTTRYRGLISCVLFYGGEWEPATLIHLAALAKDQGLVTCLYTGCELTELSRPIFEAFDYLKTGRWQVDLGGLTAATTNQRFYRVQSRDGLFSFDDQTEKFRSTT